MRGGKMIRWIPISLAKPDRRTVRQSVISSGRDSREGQGKFLGRT